MYSYVSYVTQWVACFLVSCGQHNDIPLITIDMASERDAGRFLPDAGDRISIVGDFNDWQPEAHVLESPEGDWHYALTSSEWLGDYAPEDTVAFKFVILPGQGRSAQNAGWETLPNREITVAGLREYAPVFTFNEHWTPEKTARVTFRVNMSNQQVLGYFDPGRGDKVVVTGSFLHWHEDGVELTREKDDIYAATIPVRYMEGEPLVYKYRILPGKNLFIPNAGWENTDHRNHLITQDEETAEFAWFGGQRRVARFMVDTRTWQQEKTFLPDEGQVLQVELYLQDRSTLTDPLVRTGPYTWETSVAVPHSVKEISYRVIKDLNTPLTGLQPVEVPFTGKRVVVNPEVI